MKKSVLIFLLIVAAVAVSAAFHFRYERRDKKSFVETAPLFQVSSHADTLTIIGVGDMMLGTNYPSTAYLAPNDGRDLLSPVEHILQNADVTFGNCEGTFLDEGGTVKQCNDPSKCYAFRQPTRYVEYLVEAGFDMVSIANNHTGDFGDVGRTSTVKTLAASGLKYAGLLACPTTIFEKDGVKYGLAAMAPNTGTVDIRDIEGAKKIVSELSKQCDIVIVSFHGGAEGPQHTHVKNKTEIFYEENRGNVVAFSHAVIDAGADVVFGHGPHVTRAIELYKDRMIAYSLGNFCTYARFSLSGPSGMAPILKLDVNKKGEFLSGEIFAIKQEGEGGPQLDMENRVITEIISLTESDFPNNDLQISLSGLITRK
ncbi:MAG: CapA family protein [Flavobacteriales bacterium]|nr:CapA family protein [Flavobacteriales bacterium]